MSLAHQPPTAQQRLADLDAEISTLTTRLKGMSPADWEYQQVWERRVARQAARRTLLDQISTAVA